MTTVGNYVKIEPYKRRKINASEDVRVYRNLHRPDGPWYSIMQRGRVVAHAREVDLVDVKLVVRPAGHQRVLETGMKNVHAFVVGRLIPHTSGDAVPGRYNPRVSDSFEAKSYGRWRPVREARAAHLGPTGLSFFLD